MCRVFCKLENGTAKKKKKKKIKRKIFAWWHTQKKLDH